MNGLGPFLFRLLPQEAQDRIGPWIVIVMGGLVFLVLLLNAALGGKSTWARVWFGHAAAWWTIPIGLGVLMLSKGAVEAWASVFLLVGTVLAAEAFLYALVWSVARPRSAEQSRGGRAKTLLGEIVLMLLFLGVSAGCVVALAERSGLIPHPAPSAYPLAGAHTWMEQMELAVVAFGGLAFGVVLIVVIVVRSVIGMWTKRPDQSARRFK